METTRVFTMTILGVMLATKLFPDTPAGRWLHRAFVEEPIRLFDRMTWRHLILAGFMMFAFQAFAVTGAVDLTLLMAVDTATYLEAATAVWAAAALGRAGVVVGMLRALMTKTGSSVRGRLLGRTASRRRCSDPTRRKATPVAEEDDPTPALRRPASRRSFSARPAPAAAGRPIACDRRLCAAA